MSAIQSALNMIKFYDGELKAIKQKQTICFVELKKFLAEETGIKNPYFYLDFGWPCKDSPIKTCIYDNDEDRCHDSCIYCYEPYERK